MDKIVRWQYYNELFTLYSALLTDQQRNLFMLYYQYDLSLSEIADSEGISKAAVSDSLRKTTVLLQEYEQKLQLLAQTTQRRELVEQIVSEIDCDPLIVSKLRSLI